jgi:nicotinamidase/pyrazinamidase
MKTLIVVDLQNDFLPTGALPVPEGDRIIPIVNMLIPHFDLVIATQDWHPISHKSFAINHNRHVGETVQLDGINQILWPVHCVQKTKGAEFADELDTSGINRVFRKGENPEIDSYSGFFDNDHQRSTGLDKYLKENNATDLFFVGLALEYCVKFSAMDSKSLGFNTTVILDATRAVNVNVGDSIMAIEEFKDAKINILNSDEI